MDGLGPRRKGDLACDPCRLLKVKCLRDTEGDATCRKCKRSGAACTWTSRQIRARRRPENSNARISALEAKIDQLMAVVAEQPFTPTDSDGLTSETKDNQATVSQHDDCLPSILHDRFQLSIDAADRCLRHFRNMTLYFPFIIIPASTSVEDLAQRNPTLLLAILTTSSSQDKILQVQLEEKLRKDLVDKIMLRGEKNLELLAALLVYLGWCHFYYVPGRDSIMQFMTLAISICEELGLGLTLEEAANRRIRHRLDHYKPTDHQIDDGHDTYFSGEARRLYLGTCFLVTW
jgi:hypothetical protein